MKRIVILLLMLTPVACLSTGPVYVSGNRIPNLYAYNSEDIREVLKKKGLDKIFDYQPRRNSDGTELHFRPYKLADKKVLIFHIDGTVELRENAETDSYGKSFIVRLMNAVGDANFDILQIRYFFGRRVFSDNETIYIFGYDRRRDRRCDDGWGICIKTPEIICHILKPKKLDSGQQDMVVVQTIHIPRPSSGPSPFYVLDMNASSGDVLLLDSHDLPSFPKWYIFNLKNQKMKKIGIARTYGLFLSDDILENVKRRISDNKEADVKP